MADEKQAIDYAPPDPLAPEPLWRFWLRWAIIVLVVLAAVLPLVVFLLAHDLMP
jgi:hypothetical protein